MRLPYWVSAAYVKNEQGPHSVLVLAEDKGRGMGEACLKPTRGKEEEMVEVVESVPRVREW